MANDRDDELDREIRAHLELEAEERFAEGLTEEEARYAARRAFGNVARTREDVRGVWVCRWLADARQDVRHALRSLGRTPAFTTVALLTLALGIGANTAIFSVTSAVLLRPLPFPDADRLVHIFETYTGPLGRPLRQSLPGPDLRVLRSASRTMSDIDAYGPFVELRLGRDEQTDLPGARVSRATLSLLGAQPALGRLYDERESTSMAPVLVLAHSVWRRQFGGDPAIIGRTVIVEGTFPPPYGEPRQLFTVVGVMTEGFQFPNDETAFWVPLNLAREGGLGTIARLNDGVSPEVATSEVRAIFGAERPDSTFEVVRVRDERSASIRPALAVLLAAVALLLLIACANLASLLLARTTARQRELALRSALGAPRGRLIRQLLTETLLIAAMGGAAGVMLALGGIQLLRHLLAGLASRPDLAQLGAGVGRAGGFASTDVRLDALTLAFTAAVCLLAGLLSGVAPVFASPRRNYMRRLHEGTTSAPAGFRLLGRNVTRSVLVVAQVTLAVALLVGGGLLMHSFVRMLTLDKGYDARSVLTFNVRLPPSRSTAVDTAIFADRLVARLQTVPGVRSAGYTFAMPTVSLNMGTGFRLSSDEVLPRRPPGSANTAQNPSLLMVSAGYPRALGMRLVAGRYPDDYQNAGGSRGILINESLARARFPDGQAVGRYVYLGNDAPWEIAGVVGDVWQRGLDEAPGPQVFTPFPAVTDPFLRAIGTRYYYAVQTAGPPLAALPFVRDAVRQVDGAAMLDNVAPLDQVVASSIARPRMYAALLGVFAAAAVILAAVGIYGVMAYAVAQNTREIGVRMALGAERREVLGLVLGRAAVLAGTGLALGLAAAAALSRYLTGMIFGLTPLDPSTYAAVAVTFAAVALGASYVPARRATRVDPLLALRAE